MDLKELDAAAEAEAQSVGLAAVWDAWNRAAEGIRSNGWSAAYAAAYVKVALKQSVN